MMALSSLQWSWIIALPFSMTATLDNALPMADFDECKHHSTYDCDVNADCKNTIGSYECQCRDGYRGNGMICNGMLVYTSFAMVA